MRIRKQQGLGSNWYTVRSEREFNELSGWMDANGVDYIQFSQGEFGSWTFKVVDDHAGWFVMRWSEEIT